MSSGTHFLDVFFNPRSVAVVGASRNVGTANYWLTANLVNLKYPGHIYPVNPNAAEILGLKCYASVRDIPGEVDLAAISVPAAVTTDVVRDCVAKGVKAAVIIAGGFSETGVNGRDLQDEVRRMLKEAGIRCIGPNSSTPLTPRSTSSSVSVPPKNCRRAGYHSSFNRGCTSRV